jgi:hypothetical protein
MNDLDKMIETDLAMLLTMVNDKNLNSQIKLKAVIRAIQCCLAWLICDN